MAQPFPAAECPLLLPRLTGETVHLDLDWSVRKDTTQVAVSYSSAPVDLTDGRGAVVAFRDISDRLRLREVEASRARIAKPPTRLAGRSNVTSTTARSSNSSPSRCDWKRPAAARDRPDDAARLVGPRRPTCAKPSQNSSA